MNMPIKIAVSGAIGSFSEEAGRLYAEREGIEAEMIYAIDMDGVLNCLDKREADLGIFPVVNSSGGLVQMAFEAMGRHLFTLVGELWMEVHQCLLALPGVAESEIKKIVSHPQAITQCERFLRQEFSRAELVKWIDTAQAARDLAEGRLNREAAVIAPARAAQVYGLAILRKGIQDNHPNLTTFIIVKK